MTKENVQSTRRISFLSFILECKTHTGRDFCSVEISEIALKSWGSCPDIFGGGGVMRDRPQGVREGALPPTESCGRPRGRGLDRSCLLATVRAAVLQWLLGLLFFPASLCSLYSACEAGSNTHLSSRGSQHGRLRPRMPVLCHSSSAKRVTPGEWEIEAEQA